MMTATDEESSLASVLLEIDGIETTWYATIAVSAYARDSSN